MASIIKPTLSTICFGLMCWTASAESVELKKQSIQTLGAMSHIFSQCPQSADFEGENLLGIAHNLGDEIFGANSVKTLKIIDDGVEWAKRSSGKRGIEWACGVLFADVLLVTPTVEHQIRKEQ